MGAVSLLQQKGSFVDMQDWDVSGREGGVCARLQCAELQASTLVGQC